MVCHVMDTFWKRIESFEFEKIMQNSRFCGAFFKFGNFDPSSKKAYNLTNNAPFEVAIFGNKSWDSWPLIRESATPDEDRNGRLLCRFCTEFFFFFWGAKLSEFLPTYYCGRYFIAIRPFFWKYIHPEPTDWELRFSAFQCIKKPLSDDMYTSRHGSIERDPGFYRTRELWSVFI